MGNNCFSENQKVAPQVRRPLFVLNLVYWCLLSIWVLWDPSLWSDGLLSGCLFFIGIFLVSFYLLLGLTAFVTIIQPGDRIDICFWPFFKETIKISAIIGIDIMEHEISGFGVRYDLANQTTYYKASGNSYLRLTLSNNKKILIGTHKPAELQQLLKKTAPVSSQAIIKSLSTQPKKFPANYNS